jgi:hypothetical protein
MGWISAVIVLLAQIVAISVAISGNISLNINNCRGAKLKFKDSWTISLDAHCQEFQEKLLFEIVSVSDTEYQDPPPYFGIYEPYGRSGGTTRYEKVLSDGRTFKLLRHREGKLCQWIVQKGNQQYFLSKCRQPDTTPPQTGWKSVSTSTSDERIEVRQMIYESDPYLVRRMNLKKYLSPSIHRATTTSVESSITGEAVGTDEPDLLSQMLHPAVGRALGEALHKRYISGEDRPIDSITIDGLFNHSLLASALEFEKVFSAP